VRHRTGRSPGVHLSFENLLDVLRVLAGIWQALWLLRRLAPDVVFSKGGFVSFPVVFAAWVRLR
jgi:UDP-N-acetylglucosamine--N-acetylmuramyl-(pentapeptide) pyrophosphoryl-undecaprenol N-acetylglucosamine transferase